MIVAEELNVKNVKHVSVMSMRAGVLIKETSEIRVALNLTIDEELKLEGLVRELTRQINSYRREKGLTLNDRVALSYQTESEDLKKVFASKELVEKLCIATLLTEIKVAEAEKEVDAGGEKIKISLL